jgi:ABC-2 type transport system ATP-binding protein
MTSLVSASGVSKRFGDLRAVDNVSFEIEKGRILGLIGPNGAGKTTLLKALLGLTDCDGQLSVLGLDPFRQRKQLMQNICFIADVAVLPRWIRVSQLLDFIAETHPIDIQGVRHALQHLSRNLDGLFCASTSGYKPNNRKNTPYRRYYF